MERFLFLFVHLAIPILIGIGSILYKSRSRLGLVINTSFSGSVLIFLFLWGQWPIVGSYYLQYVLLAVIALIGYRFVARWRSGIPNLPGGTLWYLLLVPLAALTVFISVMIYQMIAGTTYPVEGTELYFPLKHGRFYIANGGSSRLLNNHFRPNTPEQQFALDINRLGKWGGVSENIFSTNNESYYSFADTVYCPCTGRVIDLSSDVEDNLSSSMNVSPKQGRGNFVKLDCDGVYISLYHLKNSSIRVSKDSVLQAGIPLGLVGNSGFSEEPHLHIHAAVYTKDSTLAGIPVKLKNRYLSRNDWLLN